ncbi:hypothetical protein AVEN_41994-1 [Araneus ventricosus]|uniref:Uncharacterized protein n=1 Tax=Araneus ventricosus TaxID=182803 RepID=A0A4Y2WFU2_ARAVE|nr:hypothetical protein AVEN_41994-1 [Araneus ventricosus]
MEKYGYIICDVCTMQEYLYIPPVLFNSLVDSGQHVVLRQSLDPSRKVIYFKILNNSEIVQYIHCDDASDQFGFCLLQKTNPVERFKLHSTRRSLYDSVFECLLTPRESDFDEAGSCARHQIGYFNILSDT